MEKIDVIRQLLRLQQWISELDELLRSASSEIPEYTREEGRALALLALHRSAKIDENEVLLKLPRKFSGKYFHAEDDRRLISQIIKNIDTEADPSRRRRIATLLKALEE
jgi:hypothetical protein